jgi:hypothetical protein
MEFGELTREQTKRKEFATWVRDGSVGDAKL